MDTITRRRFLEFMGRGASLAAGASLLGPLTACSVLTKSKSEKNASDQLPFRPLYPTRADRLVLAEGFTYSVLATWGDTINAQGERFGFNNDYIAFLPLKQDVQDDGILWVNHEYPNPLFISGYLRGQKKTRKQVEAEMDALGGSLLRVKKNASGQWRIVKNDPLNRRITGRTPISFAAGKRILDARTAIGTMANCAGGVTPWGTILTCEENYHEYYGETDPSDPKKRVLAQWHYDWQEYFDHPPEHYGWVVEIDPKTGNAKKHVSLGRFAHESATTVQAKDGRVAVYSGDDANDECIYKFVSDQPGSLERGTLYVANTETGRWIPLDLRKNPDLHSHFKDQIDLLIHTRKAARLVGGTPQARPEDIEIDPKTGAVLIALSNNKPKGDLYGSILKIIEKDNDPLALEFTSSTFVAGGPESGFAAPDNMAFDRAGNLWLCTDMSGSDMGKPKYEAFGNNGLFFIPMSGPEAGRVFQVASAPVDAELTGPCFSPDGRTLFLSVQHPGEYSESLDKLTSHWPEGGSAVPKPAVVTLSGPALDRIIGHGVA